MRLIIFFSFLLVLFSFSVFSQEKKIGIEPSVSINSLSMDQWTGEDGLISNNLTSVNQSSGNFIWITSFNGIIRFDGINFRLYDKTNLPFINSNGFYRSFEDREKRLWFTAQSSDIIYYKDGRFHQVISELDSSHSVRCVAEDLEGNIWAGTNNEGIYILEDSSLKKMDFGKFNFTPIMDIEVDNDGKIWFATNGSGVLTFKNNVIEQYNTQDGLNHNSINKLLLGPDGAMYAGTFDGIYRFSEKGNEKLEGFEGIEINDLLIDDYQNLWVGSEQGLLKYNLKDNTIDRFTEADGLPGNQVSAVCFDHENSLWLSTKKAGLIRLRAGIFKNITKTDGLSSNNVNIVVEHNDKFYIGCDDGLISVYADNRISPFQLKSTFFNIGIRDINFGDDGQVFVASYQGLTEIKNEKEKFIDMKQYGSTNDIRRILRGKDGVIWLATRSGGLVKYPDSNHVTVYNKSNGLMSNYILAIEQNSVGDIYVGTHSGGLSMIKANGEIINYPIEGGKAGILIFNIQIQEDNSLWLATNVGLYKFSKGNFMRINLDQYQKSETIFDIVIIDDYAWLSINLGLVRVSTDELEKYLNGEIDIVTGKLFDRYDGMASQECTGATRMTIGSNGKLWVPTLGGVAVLNPKNIENNDEIPIVYITDFFTDLKERDLSTNETIEVEPGTLRFEFQFASLSYIAPPKVEFKYILKGIDEDWIEAGAEREAIYTNLPYGNYEFNVIASNNDGVWNTEGATIKFKVKPFFYETVLFYVIIIAFIGLIIWGIFIWRVHNIERVNAELRKLNEELDRFVYSASHDLRAPLSSVLGLAEIARLEPTIEGKNKCLAMINVSIKKLDGFINDIIDYSRNQRVELQSDKIDLEKEIQDVLDDLRYLDNDLQINKIINCSEKRHFMTDGRRLSVVLKNLISNAIRYHDPERKDPFISISVKYKGNNAIIKIEDNGIGIEVHHLENIFKMFYRADETSKGSGLGLYIVKETVDKLNGTIEVTSNKGKGTTFILTIPSLRTVD